MFDHLFTSSHVASRMHRVDGAALRVDVREGRQGSLLKIAVEFVRMDKSIHSIVLNPLASKQSVPVLIVL